MLSYYFEITLCAKEIGFHYVSTRSFHSNSNVYINQNNINKKDNILDIFFSYLPQIIYNNNTNHNNIRITKNNLSNICQCENNDCHEFKNSLQYKNIPYIINVLDPAIKYSYKQYVNDNININPNFNILDKAEKHNYFDNPVTSSSILELPLLPEVTIHFRCSDNIHQRGYGLLPFYIYLRYIPRNTSTIYIITESKHRKPTNPNANTNGKICNEVLDSLYEFMKRQYSNSYILIIRGSEIVLDFMRIASANITICSVYIMHII